MPPVPDLAALPDLPPVQHAGERVLTTDLLARVYGVEPDNIHDNHRRNPDRFVEGVHFHKVTGEALRAFKDRPDDSRLVGANARSLTLWTERGAARHAKLIQSDAAWTVFGRLEEHYFASVPPAAPSAPAALSSPRAALSTFKAYSAFGKLIGLDRNQAILAANRATRKTTGIDLLADMEVPHLLAPHQDALMTVTEVGMKLGGKSARETNLALTRHGFQTAARDPRGVVHYEATDLGRPYSRVLDVDKAQGTGAPVLQLRWLSTVVGPLAEAIGGEIL